MAAPKFASENFRQVLHAGYTFVRSLETNKAISALTLDHLIQDHIDSLKQGVTVASAILDDSGKSVGDRISRWDRVDEVEKLLTQAVKALKDAGTSSVKLAALGIDNNKPVGEFDAPPGGVV